MTDFHKVEANLRDCFRTLASRRDRAEIRQLGGVEVVSLGVRFPMFNAAFLASPVKDEADLERRIATAAVHFQARGVGWSFWLCDGWLPETVNRRAPRLFARRNLHQATEMPGMIAPALKTVLRDPPAFQLEAVDTESALGDFCLIGSRCFRVPQNWFEEVFDLRTRERAPFRAWVAYAGTKPVVSVATLLREGVLGIYNVATVPEFRRAGYAEAVMRECVAREPRCAEPIPLVLQSTASGVSLYERMGFDTVTRFRVWVS